MALPPTCLFPVAHASRLAILVQFPIEVLAFEDELHGGGSAGGIPLRVELADGGPQSTDFRDLAHILHGGHPVTGIDPEAAVEVRQELIEFLQEEVAIEDIEHGALD